MAKVKIAIFGLGGVGGFLGARLAHHYQPNAEVEIYFVARGLTLRNVQEHGLILDSTDGSFVGRPTAANEDPARLGVMDYVLYCTKSYDVASAVTLLQGATDKHTVIVSFMNGVDGTEALKRLLPENEVWDGCVFIDSKIAAPGHILESTNKYLYLYGSTKATPEKLAQMDQIFQAAAIHARSFPDIEYRVWNKFAFISTLATLTSYTNDTYGQILSTPAHKQLLIELLDEFGAVAKARGGVSLGDHLTQEVLDKITIVSPNSTTSMQRDFNAGKRTELESLTGYVIAQGKRCHVATPTYEMIYKALEPRKNGK